MSFDAKAARAKRPLPLWVDAFTRDTSLLETDEIGAYFKLLMAMWSSRAVALPDDPRKLARAAGVTVRLWNSRIWPSLEEFFTKCPEGLTQKRLREEADYVERQCRLQSERRNGSDGDGDKKSRACAKPTGAYEQPRDDAESQRNTLKYNNQKATADKSADPPVDQPTQQPNNPTYIGGGGSAGAREAENQIDDPPPTTAGPTPRDLVLEAMGLAAVGVAGPGRFLGGQGDVAEMNRWLDLPGVGLPEVCEEVRRIAAAKADGPPSSFRYFTPAMQRLSAALAAPKLEPVGASPQQARASPVHRWKLDPDKFNDDGSIRE